MRERVASLLIEKQLRHHAEPRDELLNLRGRLPRQLVHDVYDVLCVARDDVVACLDEALGALSLPYHIGLHIDTTSNALISFLSKTTYISPAHAIEALFAGKVIVPDALERSPGEGGQEEDLHVFVWGR